MADEPLSSNSECRSSSHEEHLCYLILQGFNISDEAEYKALIEDPMFKCSKCGRSAHRRENLCKPARLSFNKKNSNEELRSRALKYRSVSEVLDAAMRREVQAQELYTKMAFMVKNPWMRKVIEGFAQQERQHLAKLRAVKAGRIELELSDADPAFAETLEDVEPHEDINYPELLAYAIKKENRSCKFYTLMASMVSKPELKDMFLKLAQEEANHRKRLEQEYSQVTS
jgi:rubrerythrin